MSVLSSDPNAYSDEPLGTSETTVLDAQFGTGTGDAIADGIDTTSAKDKKLRQIIRMLVDYITGL